MRASLVAEGYEMEADDILRKLMADIDFDFDSSSLTSRDEDINEPSETGNVIHRVTRRKHLQVLIVSLVVTAIIAGFWGPQITRALRIPIGQESYTSIYFEDPTVVQRGLVAGDLLVFGLHNGSEDSRSLKWKVLSGRINLAQGVASLDPNSDSYVQISTAGAISGQKLSVYLEGISAPITVEVVG
jgi:hypothetical protein